MIGSSLGEKTNKQTETSDCWAGCKEHLLTFKSSLLGSFKEIKSTFLALTSRSLCQFWRSPTLVRLNIGEKTGVVYIYVCIYLKSVSWKKGLPVLCLNNHLRDKALYWRNALGLNVLAALWRCAWMNQRGLAQPLSEMTGKLVAVGE